MSIEDAITGAMAEARDEGILEDAPTGDFGDGVEVQPATEEDGAAEVIEPATKTDGDTAEADAEAAAKVVADKAEADAALALAEKNKGKTPEQILKEELGPDKNERGKENKIPHSRVVKIVDNQVNARLDPVRVALGIDAKDFSVDKVVARIAQAKDMETEIQNNRNGEFLMDSNPEKFIRTLAAHHPGYKRFVDLLDGVVKPAERAAEKPAVDPTNDPEPEPDFPLKDAAGVEIGRTYSVAGMKKRDEWRDRQTEARIFANPKLKSVLDRDEAQARISAAEPGLKMQMDDARTWEGFSDSEQEILQVLVDDSTQAKVSGRYKHDLNSAYRKIVLPKLKAAKEAAEKATKEAEALGRKKAIADIKKRPASTSAPASGGKTPESTGPRDLTDVIKEQVAALKGGRA